MLLHESLNSVPLVGLRMEQIAIDAICEVCLVLLHLYCLSLILSHSPSVSMNFKCSLTNNLA